MGSIFCSYTEYFHSERWGLVAKILLGDSESKAPQQLKTLAHNVSVYNSFPQKDLAPFFLCKPHKETFFQMTAIHPFHASVADVLLRMVIIQSFYRTSSFRPWGLRLEVI